MCDTVIYKLKRIEQTYKLLCKLLVTISPHDRIIVLKSSTIDKPNYEEEMTVTHDGKNHSTNLREPTTQEWLHSKCSIVKVLGPVNIQILQNKGHNIVIGWDCQFKHMCFNKYTPPNLMEKNGSPSPFHVHS